MIFLHWLVVFSSPQSIATSEHPDNIKIKQSKKHRITPSLIVQWPGLMLALPPGDQGTRAFQCFECDRPDPLKTDKANRLAKGRDTAAKVRRFHITAEAFNQPNR
jgi:hypothetical protein